MRGLEHFPIFVSERAEEKPFQVSKWMKVQVLLSAEEMDFLLQELGKIHFVIVSEPVVPDQAILTPEKFSETYRRYVEVLERGMEPVAREFRAPFSSAMSRDLRPFYAIPVTQEKLLIKPKEPIIQLQAHSFLYSELKQEFHPMVFGQKSISWGLQFSYPQWYQDGKTFQIHRVNTEASFRNTSLFSELMKWMRRFTLPTPCEVRGKKINAPIRIGRGVFSWISSHAQLKNQSLRVIKPLA